MKVSLSEISVLLPGMARSLFAIRELTVESGDRVLIQGPSGRGKTTLLHLIAGLMAPERGSILLDGQSLADFSESERCRFRRERVGLVFQKLNLISHLKAWENVALTLHGKSLNASELFERSMQCLRQVQMAEFADVFAQNLSVGQQQRVAVARVMASQPNLILADEPTSSLDDDNAEAVIKSLLQSGSEATDPATSIVVSHDQRIRRHFSRIIEFASLVGS